jgi:adenylate cyclase class 2
MVRLAHQHPPDSLIYKHMVQVRVIEIESKYHSPGNDKVEKALAKLGGKKIAEGLIEDIYFSHPGRDFGKTDEALRIRKMEDGSELSYKGPRMKAEDVKAREEVTLKIDNSLAAQRIIERLGFTEVCSIKKKRTSYVYDKIRIDLDDVEGLGEFVEIEILTESPDRTAALFETAVKELALQKSEPKTYLELILEKESHKTRG